MTETQVKVKQDSLTDERERFKYYANPEKVEYETLRTDKGIKIIQVKRYGNGVIKRRLKHISQTDAEVTEVIARLKGKK